VGGLKLGTPLSLHIPAIGKDLAGTVGEIAPVGDANSRTFLVKIDLPPDAGLRAGLFGRVAVPAGEYRSIFVPNNALRTRGQLEQVFVVEKGIARLRLVRVGKHLGSDVELLSGVAVGDSVVVGGTDLLVDGQSVEVRP
jgi:multidrug efflux pump subunit AcrA (membrane-fusion protein)